MGAEMEKEYLRDAKDRLKNPGLWQRSAVKSIRALAMEASPEIKTQLEDIGYR